MSPKISMTQKVTVFLSLAFYIVTLICFFMEEEMVMLVFFILHSIAVVYACYLAFTERIGSSEYEEMTHRIETLEQQKDSLEQEMNEKITLAGEELSVLKGELQASQNARDENKNVIERLEMAIDGLNREVGIVSANVILPGYEDKAKGADKECVDIIEISKCAVDQLKASAEAAELVVTVASTEEKLVVMADRQWLLIMFKNIIDNSIKYVKRKGVLVITISTIGDDIFIVLKDNGEGLSVDETNHIFELNYQGSNRISGNGLGLYQARAIVEYYGGTIYAKSTPGSGMGVYIQLPASSGTDNVTSSS